MINRFLLVVTFFFSLSVVKGQSDTLKWHTLFRLQGMLNTGTLSQYGGNAGGSLSVENEQLSNELSLNYAYNSVREINIINDSWNHNTFRLFHHKRIYAVANLYYGFAKSAGINSAWVGGAGLGMHIWKKSQKQFLHLNVTGNYLLFDYTLGEKADGFAYNVMLKGMSPLIKKKLIAFWEFHGFYAPGYKDIYGWQNNLRLAIPISKKIDISITHQLVYNERVNIGKKRLNTMTLLGVSLHH